MTAPQIAISRVFAAPRTLVYRAFTDPAHLAAWWGPTGNALLPESIDFDVRPGGHQRWTEVFPDRPGVRIHVRVDLTDVVADTLLAGTINVTGRLPAGIAPHTTRFRFEFHDEPAGRTRLEIRQWVPTGLTGPATQGWAEALTKLDATLTEEPWPTSPM